MIDNHLIRFRERKHKSINTFIKKIDCKLLKNTRLTPRINNQFEQNLNSSNYIIETEENITSMKKMNLTIALDLLILGKINYLTKFFFNKLEHDISNESKSFKNKIISKN